MALTQNEILNNTRAVLKQVPFRTNFERDNFVYGVASGPRLLVSLCQEMEFLNTEANSATNDWSKASIVDEMNIINAKIAELHAEVGSDVRTALEAAESEFWVEELAKKAAVEAICQTVTVANMEQMLKLPAELYEASIVKCQTFLNVINKTTRQAERKANVGNVQSANE
jgi:hypothetical protein